MRADDATAWILQANPREWDVGRFIADVRHGRTDGVTSWLAPRHRQRIAVGDRVFLWVSGKGHDAGIVAAGEVVEAVAERAEEKPEYRMPGFEAKYEKVQPRVRIAVEPLRFQVSRPSMKRRSELADLSILRQPEGTVFPVQPEERVVLDELCRNS